MNKKKAIARASVRQHHLLYWVGGVGGYRISRWSLSFSRRFCRAFFYSKSKAQKAQLSAAVELSGPILVRVVRFPPHCCAIALTLEFARTLMMVESPANEITTQHLRKTSSLTVNQHVPVERSQSYKQTCATTYCIARTS